MSKYYLVEMPDKWVITDCWSGTNCIKCQHITGKTHDYCPLANAKEAVEVSQADTFIVVTKAEEDGKPVKLWATEDK